MTIAASVAQRTIQSMGLKSASSSERPREDVEQDHLGRERDEDEDIEAGRVLIVSHSADTRFTNALIAPGTPAGNCRHHASDVYTNAPFPCFAYSCAPVFSGSP